MKISNLIEDKPARRMKIIITESQFQRLANSVVSLMEQEKITKTYLINKQSNGK